jgi:hypothetical protein
VKLERTDMVVLLHITRGAMTIRVMTLRAGNTIGGSITVPLTSCLTGLDKSVFKIKTKIVSCHTANSKPVKQEVNSTVILPPLEFPAKGNDNKNNSIQHNDNQLNIMLSDTALNIVITNFVYADCPT